MVCSSNKCKDLHCNTYHNENRFIILASIDYAYIVCSACNELNNFRIQNYSIPFIINVCTKLYFVLRNVPIDVFFAMNKTTIRSDIINNLS